MPLDLEGRSIRLLQGPLRGKRHDHVSGCVPEGPLSR